jgi:hypothetical protein
LRLGPCDAAKQDQQGCRAKDEGQNEAPHVGT